MKTESLHLIARPRRLRLTSTLRNMVRETELNASDFIYPLFIRHGEKTSAQRSARCRGFINFQRTNSARKQKKSPHWVSLL